MTSIYITYQFGGNMRQKLITLDVYAFELARRKKNFSDWVRKQLHSEDSGESISELKAEIATLEKQIGFWIESVDKLKEELK